MSGLDVVDDQTFTVTLTAPFAQFPVTLGYNPFFPLPEAFFDDPEAFGTQPDRQRPLPGRRRVRPRRGHHAERLRRRTRATDAPSVEAIEYRVYADTATAYTDALAGNLDVVPSVPADASGTAAEEFDGPVPSRRRRPASPSSACRCTRSGTPTRGCARPCRWPSTARRSPSTSSPGRGSPRTRSCRRSSTATATAPATYCVLDVDRANALLDAAGFDRTQPIELWFNAGGGNDAWVEALGNQLRTNLGVEYVLRGDLAPPEYGPLMFSKGMTGPFRMGWSMDYPSPQNFLEPLYSTQAQPPAGMNVAFYSNPAFDELVAKGNAAPSSDEAIAFYNQAEDVLLEDMPVIPLLFDVTAVGPLHRRRRRGRRRVRPGGHHGADPGRLTRHRRQRPHLEPRWGPLPRPGIATRHHARVDRAQASAIAHRWHPIAAPVSDDNLRRLVGHLRLPPGGGCSTSAAASASGCSPPWRRRRARPASASTRPPRRSRRPAPGRAARNLTDRVTFEQADASGWSGEGFDAVLCIGATHAFGGLAETLTAVRASPPARRPCPPRRGLLGGAAERAGAARARRRAGRAARHRADWSRRRRRRATSRATRT